VVGSAKGATEQSWRLTTFVLALRVSRVFACCAGAADRFKGRTGSKGNIKGMVKSVSKAQLDQARNQKDADLVKTVMGTSGGDNAALARKIHDRYDKCAPAAYRGAQCARPASLYRRPLQLHAQ
jgi:hypothetical protein